MCSTTTTTSDLIATCGPSPFTDSGRREVRATRAAASPSQEAAADGPLGGISAATQQRRAKTTAFSVRACLCLHSNTQTHYTNNYTASQLPAKAAASRDSLPHNSSISKRGCFCWFAQSRGATVPDSSVARWDAKDLRTNTRLNVIIF